GTGPRTGFHHRVCGGHGNHLFLAGGGQADPRQHQFAGPPRRGGLSARRGLHLRHAQSDRRRALQTSGSPGSPTGSTMMAAVSSWLERSHRGRLTADFFRSGTASFGFVVLIVVIGLALFAPYVTLQDPYDLTQIDVLDSRLPPGS